MYTPILFTPLYGALTSGLFGRSLGATGAQWITTTSIVFVLGLVFTSYYEIILMGSSVSVNIVTWIDSGNLLINWGLYYDSLTVNILLAVVVVSSMVHVYSMSYIETDPHTQRFFSYLSLFTGSIILLVTTDSYLGIFVGWELIGVASYLLIGFWFTRTVAGTSAIQAMIVNRVGDAILSVGFLAILWTFGNLDFTTVFSLAPYINEYTISVIGLCLLGGAMSKSANLPLQTWLPSAIEGPTPVSALIHAATLVTAGVYLLLRSSPILEYAPNTLMVITVVGSLTAFYGATSGLLQSDIKRVIAFSTCSQIGYLVIAIGCSQYEASIYHMVNHAFFKALLFMSAGSLIHGVGDEQDSRRMGGLMGLIPFTYVAILVGSYSLMAIPYLTGFYSKDLVLELVFGTYSSTGQLAYWLGTVSAGLTAFYSVRLISLGFLGIPHGSRSIYQNVHEAPLLLAIPIVVLSVFSIGFGYFAKDWFVGIGTDSFQNALYTSPDNISMVDAEIGMNQLNKLLPMIATLIGALISWYYYVVNIPALVSLTNNATGNALYQFLYNKWNIDSVYNNFMLPNVMESGLNISKTVDRGIIDYSLPSGLSYTVPKTGNIIVQYDTGIITSYAMYIVLGVITIVFVMAIPMIGLIQFELIILYMVSTIFIAVIKNNTQLYKLFYDIIMFILFYR